MMKENQYPALIPLIIEPYKKCALPELDRNKLNTLLKFNYKI